jgi:hypothetical protein
MQLGVEMEFWVVDETGNLCDGHDLAEAHEFAIPEFVESLVEVTKPPRESPVGIAESLSDVLDTLVRRARESNRRLVPLGTSLDTWENSSVAVSARDCTSSRVPQPRTPTKRTASRFENVSRTLLRATRRLTTSSDHEPRGRLRNRAPLGALGRITSTKDTL